MQDSFGLSRPSVVRTILHPALALCLSHLLLNQTTNFLSQIHKGLHLVFDQCIEVVNLRRGLRGRRRAGGAGILGCEGAGDWTAAPAAGSIGLGEFGSSSDMAMSSKREVAASSLLTSIPLASHATCRKHKQPVDNELGLGGQTDTKPATGRTYRLMRVVKLCIWPPLAILTAPVQQGQVLTAHYRGKNESNTRATSRVQAAIPLFSSNRPWNEVETGEDRS